MSLYAIKNDKGEWLRFTEGNTTQWSGYADTWTRQDGAQLVAGVYGGHVVELVDAPAKIVVSEEEAEMLKRAKCDDDPAELIVGFVNSRDNYDDDRKAEDRLIRAYVIGWTVEKPKRYVLPMEGTSQWGGDGKHKYAFIVGRHGSTDSGPEWDVTPEPLAGDGPLPSISKEDYGLAPAWVKAITPVEVTDDAD